MQVEVDFLGCYEEKILDSVFCVCGDNEIIWFIMFQYFDYYVGVFGCIVLVLYVVKVFKRYGVFVLQFDFGELVGDFVGYEFQFVQFGFMIEQDV